MFWTLNEPVKRPPSPRSPHRFGRVSASLCLIAGVAALGGLLVGCDRGVISGALLFIRTEFNLSPAAQGLVVGIALVGAAAAAGGLSDRFRLCKVILVAGLTFVVGVLISGLAPALSILLAGR
jgi:MFS family permease